MLTLNDGRSELWQWDTGRTLNVDADCSQVHFSNKVFGRSIDVDVADGVATIPDVLLQTDNDLNVWAFVGTAENGYTKISKTFKVNRRNKPADYVFTPTDQITLQAIQHQIGDLSDLTTAAKDTLVAAINEAARTGGGAGSMDLRVEDGYVQYSTDGGSTWENLIAIAELKGDKGDPGAPGKDGHSPVVTATKSGKTTTISVDGAAIATVEDGADGAPGKDGKPGAAGSDGITPHIGDNGNWYIGSTDTGKPSRGAQGSAGADGKDGTSATHSWNGTVLTITSASGTSSADLKGEKGDKGEQGLRGLQGERGIQGEKGDKGDAFTYSDFTAEQLAALKGPKGDKGDKGDKGADGKTPVKGTDYWTAADKQEIIDDIHSVYYIDLAGNYPDYTCPVAMADIKAAYEEGKMLECRCVMGQHTVTLPLFVPKSTANTWIFSSSGALDAMNSPTHSLTITIVNGAVQVSKTRLASKNDIPTIPTALKNPKALTFTGAVTGSYDGSTAKTVEIPSAVTDDHINSLIDTKLGVIENGAY